MFEIPVCEHAISSSVKYGDVQVIPYPSLEQIHLSFASSFDRYWR
jgi:hypothetical protein